MDSIKNAKLKDYSEKNMITPIKVIPPEKNSSEIELAGPNLMMPTPEKKFIRYV